MVLINHCLPDMHRSLIFPILNSLPSPQYLQRSARMPCVADASSSPSGRHRPRCPAWLVQWTSWWHSTHLYGRLQSWRKADKKTRHQLDTTTNNDLKGLVNVLSNWCSDYQLAALWHEPIRKPGTAMIRLLCGSTLYENLVVLGYDLLSIHQRTSLTCNARRPVGCQSPAGSSPLVRWGWEVQSWLRARLARASRESETGEAYVCSSPAKPRNYGNGWWLFYPLKYCCV